MQHGYTLIELLVVLAILGVLLSLLVGGGSRASQRAKDTAAQTHSQVVHVSIRQWLSQRPTRSATVLNGLDCAQAITLNSTPAGYTAGYTDGALGWAKPTVPMTCQVSASGRSVNVSTSAGTVAYINGVKQ